MPAHIKDVLHEAPTKVPLKMKTKGKHHFCQLLSSIAPLATPTTFDPPHPTPPIIPSFTYVQTRMHVYRLHAVHTPVRVHVQSTLDGVCATRLYLYAHFHSTRRRKLSHALSVRIKFEEKKMLRM